MAICPSNSEVSTRWPRPVVCRASSAIMMPIAPIMPAPISATDKPIFIGPPPSSPVMLMPPLKACMNRSFAGSPRRGPLAPNPLMEQ